VKVFKTYSWTKIVQSSAISDKQCSYFYGQGRKKNMVPWGPFLWQLINLYVAYCSYIKHIQNYMEMQKSFSFKVGSRFTMIYEVVKIKNYHSRNAWLRLFLIKWSKFKFERFYFMCSVKLNIKSLLNIIYFNSNYFKIFKNARILNKLE